MRSVHPLEIVDELYEVFVGMLYGPLVECARSLAFTLGLAPSPRVPWSRVFGNEITLAAPAFLSDAMPNVGEAALRDATFSHMLAVIEAFGSDRVEDGQIRSTPALMALLGEMRRARDRALRRVCPDVVDPTIDFGLSDQKTLYAIASEHGLLREGQGVTFDTYEMVSLGKQSPGFPAPIALAFAAGWDVRKRRALHRALASVWLGLQMHDDVVDWEDDQARLGSWAVSLAKGKRDPRTMTRSSEALAVRQRVHASGVLADMLARSRAHFRGARRRANFLGAKRLEVWAGAREVKLARLFEAERDCAGYAVRAHALAPWAGEVLA
jgi:hypothetical protein